MLRNMTERFYRRGLLSLMAGIALICLGIFMSVQAQPMSKIKGGSQVNEPVFRDYKGITIGMRADEIRAKLGVPKDSSAGQDFYAASDTEFVQVIYDHTQRVTIIGITYVGDAGGAPSCKAVVGEEVAAAADGSIDKLVRYPRAGYSVAYRRTAGTDPLITVTLQKFKE